MPDVRTPRPRRRARALAITLTALLAGTLIIVVGLPALIAHATRLALDAETRLQSTRVAARAVDDFVRAQCPPRWPRSWDELATVDCDHPWLPWPAERATIEANVTIDFDTTLERVADPASPPPVRPNGDCYTGWEDDTAFLRQTARELTTPDPQTPPPPAPAP